MRARHHRLDPPSSRYPAASSRPLLKLACPLAVCVTRMQVFNSAMHSGCFSLSQRRASTNGRSQRLGFEETPSRSPPPAFCTRQETRRTGIAARHASGAAPRQRACAAIRALCEQAGFVRGGARTGDGLFVDCIAPIIRQTPQPLCNRPRAVDRSLASGLDCPGG